MVYDLRNYTEENFWGPYLDDSENDGTARVDWERMEAIMLVLGYNMQKLHVHGNKAVHDIKYAWNESFKGAAPNTYVSKPMVGELEGPDFKDPYDVTGTYHRVVCFLDFHDLFAYNFTHTTPLPGEPRPPLNAIEACRSITMELHATSLSPPELSDHPDWPVVYFEGTARAHYLGHDPNGTSNIRGSVRMTKEGEVRWISVSVYNGEERWKSDGIQVGGIRSARGVLGHWFDKDHSEHGPVGPTAFWKVSDGCQVPNTSISLSPSDTSDEDYTIEEVEEEEVEDDEENTGVNDNENLWELDENLRGAHAARAAILSILGREAVEQLTENDPRARELILEILGRVVGGRGSASGQNGAAGEGSGSGHGDEDEA